MWLKLLLVYIVNVFILSVSVQADENKYNLQKLVDTAEYGATLVIPPGHYINNLIIKKPITLDGNNQVIIDGNNKGTVILIESNNVQLRNLSIMHSGYSYDQIDACIQVRGSFNIIKDNIIEDCLFGIDLQQSDHNIIRRNQFTHSKPLTLGLRGDAIRLWYSMNNQLVNNKISYFRDIVIWYSKDNRITRNTAQHGRYGLHFMYSQYNQVEDNDFLHNSVGIFLMYSDGVTVKNNRIAHSVGATGVGIGFKETSDTLIQGNQILYCATGIYSDLSPYQPETVNHFSHNEILYNSIGVLFHNDWKDNIFKENRFIGNHSQVAVQGGRSTAQRNEWNNNYWDDYQGFDRDRDGVGDTAYELYGYGDQIWMDNPSAQFFRGSLMLELIDFLERLAPLSEPVMILRDLHPSIK